MLMEQKDNLLDVIRTLLKWRKPLIIVSLITALTSVIVSLVLPNYYQADTIFLAVSPDQAMPELVFSSTPIRTAYYGNENDIDRLLTIAESNELVDFLVDTFQLFEHYDIKPDHPKARHLARLAFRDLYEVKKTKRDAIQLSVEDKDRELAMKIANVGRNKIDQFARQLIKKNIEKTLDTYEESVNTQQEQVDILSDTLMHLRKKYGIFNTVTQTEFLTNQLLESESKLARDQGRLRALIQQKTRIPPDTIAYLQANVQGLEQSIDTLRTRIERLNAGLPIVSTFEKRYAESSNVLTDDIERYKKWRDTYESEIPAIILVEQASLPAIKSRPRRSMIVLTSLAIVLLFSIMAILLIDTYQDVEWRKLLVK
jgi:uncharacterized protein involved in exopolysaccharide biosynthesis